MKYTIKNNNIGINNNIRISLLIPILFITLSGKIAFQKVFAAEPKDIPNTLGDNPSESNSLFIESRSTDNKDNNNLNNSNLDNNLNTNNNLLSEPENISNYIKNLTTNNIEGKLIKSIKIRFVNSKGSTKDKKGQIISGKSQKSLILDNIQLKQGDYFNQKILAKDLRRLQRIEAFGTVKVAVDENIDGINITYDIKENRYPSLRFGGGSNDDIGIYGQVGYKDANLNGNGKKIDGEVQISGKDVQFESEFLSPYRIGKPNNLGYKISAYRKRDFSNTFSEDIRLPDGSRVRQGEFGVSAALLRTYNNWGGALSLNYTRISSRDGDFKVATVDSAGSPLSASGTGIDDLYTVSLNLTQDNRNRNEYPNQGSLLQLSTEQAIPIGLGKISSNRLRANYIQYVPVSFISNGGYRKNPEMLAFNLQAGTIIGRFPPANAFNIGGINSVRGYEGDELASARSYGLASVEYRFPVHKLVGAVIFADFASDFGSSDTVIGEPGVRREKPGDGFGYGLGLRVRSPFGLIRGDFGVSDRGETRFEITTGQKF